MMTRVLLLLCLLVSGCTTVKLKSGFMSYNHWGEEYAGTVCNINYLGYIATENPSFWFVAPFLIIDIPLSLVADTFVLPFDLATENKPNQSSCRVTEF